MWLNSIAGESGRWRLFLREPEMEPSATYKQDKFSTTETPAGSQIVSLCLAHFFIVKYTFQLTAKPTSRLDNVHYKKEDFSHV